MCIALSKKAEGKQKTELPELPIQQNKDREIAKICCHWGYKIPGNPLSLIPSAFNVFRPADPFQRPDLRWMRLLQNLHF